MNYSFLNNFSSIKVKTIILVLFVYFVLSSIFFFIRYVDIRDFALSSQMQEQNRIKLIYHETLKRITKFYLARGEANSKSFGIQKALASKDVQFLQKFSQPRWNVISKENNYIKSFCFYDKNSTLLTYFGQKPIFKLYNANTYDNSYVGFWVENGALDYHAVAFINDNNQNCIGYIVFVIDPKYILSELAKVTKVIAYFEYEHNLYMLNEHHDLLSQMEKIKINENQEITIKHKVFLPYFIKEENAKIVFLQDITHWKQIIQKAIYQSLIVLIVLIFITIMVISYGFDIILNRLELSNKELKQSQDELQALNKNLQTRIDEEIKQKLHSEREANEKERMLVHQSKLASMGEMIGNIAHQWRQPLTQLSSILINIQMHYEKNKLTKEKMDLKLEEANQQIEYMSNTIDDFRNFYASKKTQEGYHISQVLQNVKNLMQISLEHDNITLQINILNDFVLFGYPNEVAQALLNIVCNAEDIIKERAIENGNIIIEAYEDNNSQILTIRDNAKGINVEPIDKIFEPYFTTKHAKSGTGIGLYMTKTIIEKNNHGIIKVENMSDGAIFTIKFK